jgi:hypothetical protein
MSTCEEVTELLKICVNIFTLAVASDDGISKYERGDAAPPHLIFHETSVIKYTLR